MTKLQGGLVVVVEPDLDTPCHSMRCNMQVEVCCSVWERAGNDALHDSFEGREPVVKGKVEWLRAKAGQVGTEKDVGGRTFCEPSYCPQLGPDSLLAIALPIVLVGIALASVGTEEFVVSLPSFLDSHGPAELVVRVVKSPGLKCCLSSLLAAHDSGRRAHC